MCGVYLLEMTYKLLHCFYQHHIIHDIVHSTTSLWSRFFRPVNIHMYGVYIIMVQFCRLVCLFSCDVWKCVYVILLFVISLTNNLRAKKKVFSVFLSNIVLLLLLLFIYICMLFWYNNMPYK